MTLREWKRFAIEALEKSGNPDAEADARILLSDVTGHALSELRFFEDVSLAEDERRTLDRRLTERLSGRPLQYIEGEAWFMGLRFSVDERVLIPRQDTETLCEEALRVLRGQKVKSVLDLCTGSGALAVSIARFCPGASVTASDISADALNVAKQNAEQNGVSVRFLQGDGFSPVQGERFSVIVCNPPYLSQADMGELQAEVRHEPEIALLGGEDGFDFYRRFSKEVFDHLTPGGCALFEVGEGQAQAVYALLTEEGRTAQAEIIKDLNGIGRVVFIRSN